MEMQRKRPEEEKQKEEKLGRAFSREAKVGVSYLNVHPQDQALLEREYSLHADGRSSFCESYNIDLDDESEQAEIKAQLVNIKLSVKANDHQQWSRKYSRGKPEEYERVLYQCKCGVYSHAKEKEGQVSKTSPEYDPNNKQRMTRWKYVGCLAHLEIVYVGADRKVACIKGSSRHIPACGDRVFNKIPMQILHPEALQYAVELRKLNTSTSLSSLELDQSSVPFSFANTNFTTPLTDATVDAVDEARSQTCALPEPPSNRESAGMAQVTQQDNFMPQHLLQQVTSLGSQLDEYGYVAGSQIPPAFKPGLDEHDLKYLGAYIRARVNAAATAPLPVSRKRKARALESPEQSSSSREVMLTLPKEARGATKRKENTKAH